MPAAMATPTTAEEVKGWMESMRAEYKKEIADEKFIMQKEFMDKLEAAKEELEKKLMEMNVIYGNVEKEKDKKGFKDKRFPLTTKRSFLKLPTYGGKLEDYDDWKFKATTFLNEEPEFQSLILKINMCLTEPDEKDIEEMFKDIEAEFDKANEDAEKYDEPSANIDRKWVNQQLYQVLSLNLTDTALATIKYLQAKQETNGIIGWWKLGREVNLMTSQRMQNLASKVFLQNDARNMMKF